MVIEPEIPAVYCLTHVPTGYFYIGSSRTPSNRENHWMWALASAAKWSPSHKWRPGSMLPKPFWSFVWHPREWTFVILRQVFSLKELSIAEQAELDRARRVAPDRCLNTIRRALRTAPLRRPPEAIQRLAVPETPAFPPNPSGASANDSNAGEPQWAA